MVGPRSDCSTHLIARSENSTTGLLIVEGLFLFPFHLLRLRALAKPQWCKVVNANESVAMIIFMMMLRPFNKKGDVRRCETSPSVLPPCYHGPTDPVLPRAVVPTYLSGEESRESRGAYGTVRTPREEFRSCAAPPYQHNIIITNPLPNDIIVLMCIRG